MIRYSAARALRIGMAPALFACGACGGGADVDVATVSRDSAGVDIVENSGSRSAADLGLRVTAEPEVGIGSAEGSEPAALFTYVRGGTRLGNGSIVVVDAQTNEIRWFDGHGRHIVTRGGRGRGPGEFTAITHLVRLPGDTVMVQDAPLIRQVLFTPTGELVREERIDAERYRSLGRWVECLNLTLPDRSLLGCQPEPGQQPIARNATGLLRSYSRFVRVPWTMEAAYPLGLHGGLEQYGIAAGDGQVRYALHPFHARTVVAGGGMPLRIAIALNPHYSIDIWTPEGRLERIIRRVAARHAPTPRQAAGALEPMREWGFQDDALFNRLLAEMPRPDSIPAVERLAFSPAGELWVTRGRLGTSLVDPTLIDVFDAAGRYRGELQLPPRFFLLEVGADYLLGFRLDENDVARVLLHRLAREPPDS